MNSNSIEPYQTKRGAILFVRSNEIPQIKKAESEDTPIGIVNRIIKREWRVRSSIFRFKFDCRGKSINFCIKYNIPIKNEYHYNIVEVFMI